MADIHIVREHALGLAGARKLAVRWAQVAEKKLEMVCTYVEGKASDVVHFKRAGASGELKVTKDRFQLDARLGLLLGMFRTKIETEIVKNLDQLLEHEDPLHAFEQGLQKHESRHAKHDTKHAAHKPAAKSKPPAPRKAK